MIKYECLENVWDSNKCVYYKKGEIYEFPDAPPSNHFRPVGSPKSEILVSRKDRQDLKDVKGK